MVRALDAKRDGEAYLAHSLYGYLVVLDQKF